MQIEFSTRNFKREFYLRQNKGEIGMTQIPTVRQAKLITKLKQ